jgi:hypothetical protein
MRTDTNYPEEKQMLQTQQTPAVLDPSDGVVVMTEQVARTINGISAIGHARSVLERAGYTATISANRITVNQEVTAQFMSVNGNSWWQVYTAQGRRPLWIVGGAVVDQANWFGAE